MDEMTLHAWERVAIAFVPSLLAGLSSTVVNDVMTSVAVVVAGGVVGALLTLATLWFFHQRRWPRPYGYVVALVLFVGVALVPIIFAAIAIGPSLARLAS